MSTPVSRISETISEDLLNQDDLTTVIALDQAGMTQSETPIKLKNPFAFDPQKFAPNEKPPTLENFLRLISDVVARSQEEEETLEAERVSLTDEYPLEDFNRFGEEVITWRIISRKPANMSADGKSRAQKGYTYAYHLRSPLYPDKVITVESRPVDHIIEFSCWSKRARLANRRALWLERTLVNEKWSFEAQGFDRFNWEERLADTYYNVGGQPLYQRPLRFFVRLSEFRAKADPIISHITFEIRGTENTPSIQRSVI